jgi:hypothetical protein
MLGGITVAISLCILELCIWAWGRNTINVWCVCFFFIFTLIMHDNESYNVLSG